MSDIGMRACFPAPRGSEGSGVTDSRLPGKMLAACGGAMQGPWLWGAPLSTPRTKAPWRSFFIFNVFIFPFWGLHRVVCGIFVRRPGIATVPPALQAQS